MGLPFRLFTGTYSFFMMSVALFILTCGILGKKIIGRQLVVFCIVAQVLQWIGLSGPFILFLAGADEELIASPAFDIVCYTPVALFLGWQLAKVFRIPFLHTLAASVLSTFIDNTANSVMVEVVERYSPLFDGTYLLAFVRLYIPYTLTLGVAWLTSFILRRTEFFRYFSALFRSRTRAVLTLLVCYGLMCLLPLLHTFQPGIDPNAEYAVFIFACLIVGLFFMQFTAMYTAGQNKIKAQEETILQQQAHMALLEELQQEIRAFRHDVTNLFSGLTLQAQEGDLAGIQEFMKRTSGYFDEKLGNEIAQMDGLSNIELYPLRSLLTTKLAKMRQQRIKGVLEVLRPVNRDQAMDADDLLRAVGILLDNAIEAAAKRDGLVRVVLLQEEKQLYLAVANNYDVAPNMAAIARKGYTTKGSGHGTGLSSYRRIVARCRGCAMRTYLKDGMFVQELHIPTI